MRKDINHENKKYWDKNILEVIKAVCRLEVKEEVPVWARYRLYWKIWMIISAILYIVMLIASIVRKETFE